MTDPFLPPWVAKLNARSVGRGKPHVYCRNGWWHCGRLPASWDGTTATTAREAVERWYRSWPHIEREFGIDRGVVR